MSDQHTFSMVRGTRACGCSNLYDPDTRSYVERHHCVRHAVARLWHRVFHEYWWNLGWDGRIGSKERFVHGSLCLSNFNRPILRWDFHFNAPDPGGFISFEWGNGNSDPAWQIGVQW